MPEGMFSFLIRGGNGGESVSRWQRKSPPRTLRLCSGQAAAATKAARGLAGGHDLSCPYMDGARGKLEDRTEEEGKTA